MLRNAHLSLVVAGLATSSCGNIESAIAEAVTNPGVSVAPAPSPTPAPTPTPTPTPTPSPVSYLTYDELTGSREFSAGCGNSFGTSTEGFGSYPTNPEALAHKYDAPSDSWQIRGLGADSPRGPEYTYLFGPSDLVAGSTRAATAYRKIDSQGFENRYSITQRMLGAVGAQYVRETRLIAKPSTAKIDVHCVIGVPTQPADTLPSGSFSYTSFAVAGIAFNATTEYDLGESTATWSYDSSTMRAMTSLNLIGRAITPSGLSTTRTNLGTYASRGVAFNPPNKQISGNLFSSVGDLPGDFGGSFFGPQGIELGFGFVGNGSASGTSFRYAGTVIARR